MKFLVTFALVALFGLNHAEARKFACQKNACSVQITVSRANQTLSLNAPGISEQWQVSTGKPGYTTPALHLTPNGRLYNEYVMNRGMNRVRNVVFLTGGFAIFGVTSRQQELQLGRATSNGGIRLGLKNSAILFEVVKDYGVNDVWVIIR